MSTILNFQVAGTRGGNLLERLLLESMGAESGGGIFAWANSVGAKLLLEDEVFDTFLTNGDFKLIIGTDSITDAAAIDRLSNIAIRRPRLDLHAFVSPSSGLFHPKLAWFEHDGYLSLIVGSGNLTKGGLISNWEAFTISRLTGELEKSARKEIDLFLSSVGDYLLPVSDPEVSRLVAGNSGNERNLRRGHPSRRTSVSDIMKSTADVLVAEIPKQMDRAAQANFTKAIYVNFFGAEVGNPTRRIVLTEVNEDGTMGEIETRKSVESQSQNYRFELSAMKDKPVPVDAPRIGVFLKLISGEFLYMVFWPKGFGYTEYSTLLDSLYSGPANQLRRVLCSPGEAKKWWTKSPLWATALPEL